MVFGTVVMLALWMWSEAVRTPSEIAEYNVRIQKQKALRAPTKGEQVLLEMKKMVSEEMEGNWESK